MNQAAWPARLGPLETESFLAQAEQFHGHISPGVVVGGFMVDAALAALKPTPHINAVVETVVCLPDAVQLLTPCTLGNGFLQVLDWGKFALTLYDRTTLQGVRAWLDPVKVQDQPLVADWYLRRREGGKVDKEVVIREILSHGRQLCSHGPVRLPASLKPTEKVPTGICPQCGESYPLRQGDRCLACQGQAYYRL